MRIAPHVDIGPGYLHRWHILPRNKYLNVYLHHFIQPDQGRDCHDHPWWSVSILLKGWYIEVQPDGTVAGHFRWYRPWLRPPTHAHRIIDVGPGAWTLFITGPMVRDWGFWQKGRFVPYWEYEDKA